MLKPENSIIKLTDKDVGYQYIEIAEDAFFLEGFAHNPKFKKSVGYVPAVRNVLEISPDNPGCTGCNDKKINHECHIYEICPGQKQARRICGPIAMKDGNTKVSVWGCALSTDGILYLCAYNHNKVIGIDMKTLSSSDNNGLAMATLEFDAAAPNDVCVDPKDDSIVYAAGGTIKFGIYTRPAHGQIFKATINKDRTDCTVDVVASGLGDLAGIGVAGDTIIGSYLYELIGLKQGDYKNPQTLWEGDDGNDQVWLADNIDTFPGGMLISPAYSVWSKRMVNLLGKNKFFRSVYILAGNVITAFKRGERISTAIWDSEAAVSLSNTFIDEKADPVPDPEPVRIVIFNEDGSKGKHFEVDLVETRENNAPWEVKDIETGSGEIMGKRYYFDEQVTHAGHIETESGEGYIVGVNFQQQRVLLLKDTKFKEAMTD